MKSKDKEAYILAIVYLVAIFLLYNLMYFGLIRPLMHH